MYTTQSSDHENGTQVDICSTPAVYIPDKNSPDIEPTVNPKNAPRIV